MKFLILGAGGIGSYYGTKLLSAGHEVVFVARGEQLKAIKENGLKLQHPKFSFNKKVEIVNIDEIKKIRPFSFDAIFITTKSTSTKQLAKELFFIYENKDTMPHIVSLQNGVENENILCETLPCNKIIGALTRKIGAHIVKPGCIEVTGIVETIIGDISSISSNEKFLINLNEALVSSGISCEITKDIKKELWKKLIINNGVNGICALLQIKTGPLMSDKKLNKIVLGLMKETALAANSLNIKISKKDVSLMFGLIKNFDSIKPSMLVDREFKRTLELDEICKVVIMYCEKEGYDAPYTRTISTLLEYVYNNEQEV